MLQLFFFFPKWTAGYAWVSFMRIHLFVEFPSPNERTPSEHLLSFSLSLPTLYSLSLCLSVCVSVCLKLFDHNSRFHTHALFVSFSLCQSVTVCLSCPSVSVLRGVGQYLGLSSVLSLLLCAVLVFHCH